MGESMQTKWGPRPYSSGFNPSMDRTPESQHAAAKVVDLRRQRKSWADISREVNLSVKRCRDLYDRVMAEIPASHVDEHRAEELLLCDDATANLMVIATDEQVSPRSRIEAWSTIRAWAERKAKLLGLDAPTQVVTIDKVDQEIAALQRELAAMDPGGDVPARSRVQRGDLGVPAE